MNFFATTMIAHKTRTVLNILGLIALISMGIACGAEPLLANEDETESESESESEGKDEVEVEVEVEVEAETTKSDGKVADNYQASLAIQFGGGQYHDGPENHELLPSTFSIVNFSLTVTRRRIGLLIASETDYMIGEMTTGNSGIESHLTSHRGTVAGVWEAFRSDSNAYVQLTAGASWARREYLLSDSVVEWRESSKSVGPCASVSLVKPLGDHLAFRLTGGISAIPIRVKTMDFRDDTGLASSFLWGLSGEF